MDFEDNPVTSPGSYIQINQNAIDCWQTTSPDGLIELWGDGFQGVNAFSGNIYVEINATTAATIFQDFEAAEGTQLQIRFAHRGRSGIDSIGVQLGPQGGPYTSLGVFGTDNTGWEYYTVSYTVPAMGGGNALRLRFEAVKSASNNLSVGNFLDAISISSLSEPGFANMDITPIACYGESNGSIEVTGELGVAPYSFSIDGGSNWQTSDSFTDLGANSYQVLIRDANGCEGDSTVVVVEPDSIVVDDIQKDSLCGVENGASIGVSVEGGWEPYSYSINNGHSWQSDTLFADLATGTYWITIRDARNCEVKTDNLSVISQPGGQLMVDSKTNVSCAGVDDGSINLNATGGREPYLFSIDNKTSWQENSFFNDLGAGGYTLHMRDANGCEDVTEVSLSAPNALQIEVTPIDGQCGEENSGGMEVDISGGTGPYSYSIDGGTDWGADDMLEELSEGTYTVLVRDARSCESSSVEVSVSIPDLPGLSLIEHQSVRCAGGEDGLLRLGVAGGEEPFQYRLDESDDWGATNLFTDLPAGAYVLQMIDSRGCMNELETTISEPGPLLLQLTKEDPQCGEKSNGWIEATASGGVAPYSYSIDGGANWQAGLLFELLEAGDYQVEMRDANLCLISAPATLQPSVWENADFPQQEIEQCGAYVMQVQSNSPVQFVENSWYVDGVEVAQGRDFEYEFTEPGCYDVSLIAETERGCRDTVGAEELVCILDKPSAEFTMDRDELLYQDEEPVALTNFSERYTDLRWEVNGEFYSDNVHPRYAFNEETKEMNEICLYVSNAFCQDTVCDKIPVFGDLLIFVPNAFSPDGDGVNDEFRPEINGLFDQYAFRVFNRWGELLFNSEEYPEAWDGVWEAGTVQSDVYVWELVLRYHRFHTYESVFRSGTVTVVK